MKVLDKLWFTNKDGCIGIVVIEEDVTGDRKAYIGVGQGNSEEVDTEQILAWGNKFSVDILERLNHFMRKPEKGG